MAFGRSLVALLSLSAVRPSCAGWKHHQILRAQDLAAPESRAPAQTALPSAWEASFAAGLRESEAACAAAQEGDAGRWRADGVSGAGVPTRMLDAERALQEATQLAPEGPARRQKALGLATRLYEHAKWLAERQHFTAAEQRFRESSSVAVRAGHNALATHALSRLGYFLRLWGRAEEARQVLTEALDNGQALPQSEASRMAGYMLGALERRDAIAQGDAPALFAADERIFASGLLPSKALNLERSQLVDAIDFWKAAEASPLRCLETGNAAHIAICLCSHLARAVHLTVA